MNTLTILDANTTIIPEGLYLELVNALKKDFDNKENDVVSLHYKLEGFEDGLPECLFDCYSALRYLKKKCENMDLVKSVFDDYFKDMYYDIEDDEIMFIYDESDDESGLDDDCVDCCLCCDELITHDSYTYCETCYRIICFKCDRDLCIIVNDDGDDTCLSCDIKNFIYGN